MVSTYLSSAQERVKGYESTQNAPQSSRGLHVLSDQPLLALLKDLYDTYSTPSTAAGRREQRDGHLLQHRPCEQSETMLGRRPYPSLSILALQHYRLESGNYISVTLGAHAERITAGKQSTARRDTCSYIYHVYAGSGRSEITSVNEASSFFFMSWNRYPIVLFAAELRQSLSLLGFA